MQKFLCLLLLLPAMIRAQTIAITATSDTICNGTIARFAATAGGMASPHYQWKINNVTAGTDSSGFTTSSLSNGDTVRCLLTNSSGTTVYATSDSIIMVVENMPDAGVITGPDLVCYHSSIVLTDTVPGGIWSAENDNASVSAGVVTGLRVMPGFDFIVWSTYDSIFYTVTNSCGSDVASILIEIHPLPNAWFFLGLDPRNPVYKFCVGQDVDIDSKAGYGCDMYSLHGRAYYWGSQVTGLSDGEDTLVGVCNGPCGSDTFYYPITVIAPPSPLSPILPHKQNICIGDTIQLFDSSAGSWHATNKNVSINATTGVVVGLRTGLDTIGLNAANYCGSKWTYTTITIDPPDIIRSADSLCLHGTALVTNDYPGGIWKSFDTSIITIDQKGSLFAVNGSSTFVSYTLGLCTVIQKKTISPLPVINDNHSICAGRNTFLTANVTGNEWLSNDNTIATVDNFGMVHGVSGGTVSIIYTDTIGCSTTAEFTVNPLPPSITGNTEICLNRSAYLYNNAPGGKWNTGDLSTAAIDSLTGLVHGNSSGFATITYTLPTGCATAAFIKVGYCYEPQLIYPNPSHNEVIIEADTILYSEYAIINSEGKMVAHAPIAQTFTTIDIRYLPLGVYFIHLWSPNMDFV